MINFLGPNYHCVNPQVVLTGKCRLCGYEIHAEIDSEYPHELIKTVKIFLATHAMCDRCAQCARAQRYYHESIVDLAMILKNTKINFKQKDRTRGLLAQAIHSYCKNEDIFTRWPGELRHDPDLVDAIIDHPEDVHQLIVKRIQKRFVPRPRGDAMEILGLTKQPDMRDHEMDDVPIEF